jgi:hypothetical protein
MKVVPTIAMTMGGRATAAEEETTTGYATTEGVEVLQPAMRVTTERHWALLTIGNMTVALDITIEIETTTAEIIVVAMVI